jgi:hypothetical protein
MKRFILFLFWLAVLSLFTSCQLIADKIFSPPSESVSSCVGEACKDVPSVRDGAGWKWTNRGNKSVALRVPICNGGVSEIILNPGEEHRVITWCNNCEAYYGKFPSTNGQTDTEPMIVSFEIEPKEVFAEQPTEYNLKYKVMLDKPAKAESYVYFAHEKISGHTDSINGMPIKWLVKIGNTGLINTVRTMKKEPSIFKVTAYNSVSSQSAMVTIK